MNTKKVRQPATLIQRFKHLLSVPFIYAVIVPAVFSHLIIEIYHTVCFPLYGLPYVDRKKYIKLDRHRLKYLPLLDKINCVYCGYVNGLIAYLSAIAGETEKYWCPIRHAIRKGFIDPAHHQKFAKFGDAEDYKQKISNARSRKN